MQEGCCPIIPKIIHYCWFGKNPLPPLARKCIQSWKKHCPEYEIIQWNEINFDITCNDYTKKAYEAKKWAFVSDVARLYALTTYGGVYLDTDCELIKPLDDFLEHDAVCGFESPNYVATAFMACKKGHHQFVDFLTHYKNRKYNNITNVFIITKILIKHGLTTDNKKQIIKDITIYPSEYFNPKDVKSGEVYITNNTYIIHHLEGSWLSNAQKLEQNRLNKYRKKYGNKPGELLYSMLMVIFLRRTGIQYIFSQLLSKYKRNKLLKW